MPANGHRLVCAANELQAHSLLGQGRCLARLEDPAADEPLSRALALFTDMGATARVADCDSLIAQASRLSS